jgi:hypothetical protein
MMQARLINLAKALCMTPGSKPLKLERPSTAFTSWWLVGCIEGDQALPQTSKCTTANEALEIAENVD